MLRQQRLRRYTACGPARHKCKHDAQASGFGPHCPTGSRVVLIETCHFQPRTAERPRRGKTIRIRQVAVSPSGRFLGPQLLLLFAAFGLQIFVTGKRGEEFIQLVQSSVASSPLDDRVELVFQQGSLKIAGSCGF